MNKSKSWEPIWPNFEVNGLDLTGSSKTALRILIVSIAMGAEYLSHVKSIATFALTFFGYIISVLASVLGNLRVINLKTLSKYDHLTFSITKPTKFSLILLRLKE